MNNAEVKYLKKTIEKHIRIHFHKDVVEAYKNTQIIWMKTQEIKSLRDIKPGTIIIPIKEKETPTCFKSWAVNFRKTKLILWDRLKQLDSLWQIDNDKSPFWYSNNNGSYIPSWNISGLLFNLLILKEEFDPTNRDKHGRFIGKMSPRDEYDLLEVPIFNNSVAALADLCLKIQKPERKNNIPFTKPINFSISHDLDQLRGDDFWTQLSRLGRLLSSFGKFKFKNIVQLKYIILNFMYPRKFFMDDLLKMIKTEASFGYKSTQYILCGKKGRYGARTDTKFIKRYIPEIPDGWQLGIHYNHDTHLNEQAFLKQKKYIESFTKQVITSGRAHYLKLDPLKSFNFWNKMGIRYDESLGYSDRVGYRAGIAGCFNPFDVINQKELSVLSLPLVAMDTCICDFFGEDAITKIEEHIKHLNIVGGTFTLLFHPGRFDNPEYVNSMGLYQKLLELFKKNNAKCILPYEIDF